MSGVDSEQEKQPMPISAVNGDSNIHSPGKDQQPASEEGIKGSAEADPAPVSCQSESVETAKDEGGEDKTTTSLGAEMTIIIINGVDQTVDDQKKSEQSENLGDSSVAETKSSETNQEVSDDKQVNGVLKEGESKESEMSHEAVVTETIKEQSESSVEIKQAEQSHKTVAVETNKEQGETSGDCKEAEQSQEAVSMETNGEQVKVEVAVPSESESARTEDEEGTKVEVPNVTPSEPVQNGDQLEKQLSEESKVTETGSDVAEKKRSVTIDSPENVQESDESEDKTRKRRSKTLGDIEGSSSSPLKEDVAARSKTIWYTNVMGDTPSQEPEETVSYSTSIVGGVVHRIPINTYSPKGQRKSREGSPQTSPKKRSVIDTLFGRRKKSKGEPESPPGDSHSSREENKENQQELPHPSFSGKDDGKKDIPESSPVTPDANVDTAVKDATEPLENGTNAEVEDTSGADIKLETEGNEAAAAEEGDGGVEVTPTVAEEIKEGVKENPNVCKEADVEPQDVKEESVPVESSPPKKDQVSAEEPKGEQLENKDSKEAVKRTHTKPTEEDTSSQPTPKKKKTTGIFGGFFARRMSKKSKEQGAASPPAKKVQGDKVEEQQDGSSSIQPASEATGVVENGAGQGMAPDAGDVTAIKEQEDTVTPKQEVAEGVISPAVDQTVESVQQELTDKDKVDGQEAETIAMEKPEVESSMAAAEKPEDDQKSPEETLPSKEAEAATEFTVQETALEPVASQDSLPKAQQEEEQLIQPKIEVNNMASMESEVAWEDNTNVDEPKAEDTGKETVGETASTPESKEAEDHLREGMALRKEIINPSYSPKTRRMQMRISYAERDGEGGKEVEVIGTPEKVPEASNQRGKSDHRVSCRALGEADFEGWLTKKGGMFLSGWKRKWVVLKDGKLYYFKTAFDLEASGMINMEEVTVAQAFETKKNFCFKCEQPGAKPQVSVVFMADSKEDMDRWLAVLAVASRGQVIQKPKQHHLTVKEEVAMRKKSGSNSAQRHSSVLAFGGRHDFLEDEEDTKATRRRSMSGSFTNAPKETEEKGNKITVPSVTHPAPIDEQSSDEPSKELPTPSEALSDTPPAPSNALPAPSNQQATPSEASPTPSDQPPAPSDTPPAPSDAPPAPSNQQATHSEASPAPSDQPPAPSDTPPAPSDAPPAPSNQQATHSEASPAPSDQPPAPSDTPPAPSDAPPAPSNQQATHSEASPAPSDQPPAPSDEAAPSDTPPAPSDQQPTPSDTPPAPCDGQATPIDNPPVSEPVDDSQKEKKESGESRMTEKTITVVVNKVFVGSEKVIVESASSIEMQESPVLKSSDDAVLVVLHEEDKGIEESSKISVEDTPETEKEESPSVEETDGAVSVTTTESTVTVVETVKTSMEVSETVETSTVVSVVQTEVQSSQQTLETEVKEEVTLSETSSSAPLESEPSETIAADSGSIAQLACEPPESSSSSPPESPTKTKWYFSLDRQKKWSATPELEEEDKSPKSPKSPESKTSNRWSIKSTSSDKGSIKSMSEEDQLMVMCQNIRKARLSIVGEPMLEGAERLRAISNAQESDRTFLRLKTLERTLKDKEQNLADLEELLNQPEINRRSIYEWKLRNSDLLEGLFPQEDGDEQEEDEKAAEGVEGKDESEAKEKASSSKEESDGNVCEKPSTQDGEEISEEGQKSASDEQQSVEKEDEKEKENIDDLTEVTKEQQPSPAERSPLQDSEQTQETKTADEKQEQEKDISAEASSGVKSSEESAKQQENDEALDTRL